MTSLPASTPDRGHLPTERRLPESQNLDAMTTAQALAVMNRQDRLAVEAVEAVAEDVARAVDLVAARLAGGGRLLYFGAGTSGRLGVLDASECPPTFRVEPGRVVGVIAGGKEAMFVAQEGAEDSYAGGRADVDAHGVSAADAVVGIAAGGTTPYVHGALGRARELGAATVFLTCVPVENPAADVVICCVTGPEVVTGSTRLKAGTATKLMLNQISTLAMVKLGKVHGNLMVDLRATNAKLVDRAQRLIMDLCPVDRPEAARLLVEAGGHVKLAVAMHHLQLDPAQAAQRLSAAGGHLRTALEGSNQKV
ncbi:MAG: N-acetylmuramic acid 6-phosphate etherase [Phycisphaerae bacterium]